MLDLAGGNGMKLRWDTAEALTGACQFKNLQSFLDLYFEGRRVFVAEEDLRLPTPGPRGRRDTPNSS